MSVNAFRLQYEDGPQPRRAAMLDAFKHAMVEAIATGPSLAVDATGVRRVDGPLIQLITAIAFCARKLELPFSVIDPPVDLVLGFDRLGIDWRGLDIAFKQSQLNQSMEA